jgi:hypothetical protein
MPKVAASCRSTSLVPFWIALSFWAGLSSLLILGLWLRANTYAVPPDNLTLRVLDSADLAKLSPDQQELWSPIPGSDRYAAVSIKNPFVFRLVFPYAAPGIAFAGAALISSLWNPLRPRRCPCSPYTKNGPGGVRRWITTRWIRRRTWSSGSAEPMVRR